MDGFKVGMEMGQSQSEAQLGHLEKAQVVLFMLESARGARAKNFGPLFVQPSYALTPVRPIARLSQFDGIRPLGPSCYLLYNVFS